MDILDDNSDGLIQSIELRWLHKFVGRDWSSLDRDQDGALNAQEFEVLEARRRRGRARR